MNDQLVVLTKEPRLGEAKTRLAGDVGPERARELAEAFVLDTLALARSSGVPTLVAFAPEDAGPWFEARAPWASLWPQPDGDLGQRMRAAIREALGRGAERCVMIGMDTPHLPATTLESAFAALDGADLVLGPSLDGGYYLIGAKADHPSLFEDLAWSTAAVLGATLGRARAGPRGPRAAARVRRRPGTRSRAPRGRAATPPGGRARDARPAAGLSAATYGQKVTSRASDRVTCAPAGPAVSRYMNWK